MELPERQNIDILLYDNDTEIIRDVILQFQKDVTLAGGSIEMSVECYNNVRMLKQEVVDYILMIMNNNPGLYMNLLYRIDTLPDSIDVEIIADTILSRELLKVLTRRKYK